MKKRLSFTFILILSLLFAPFLFCQEEQIESSIAAPSGTMPKKIIPMGNFTALGAYSDINKGRGLWGYDVSGYFSPAVRLNETNYLIPLYNGAIKRMRQFISQEEGGRLYNTWQIHNASLALRTKLSSEWTGRLTGLATWNFLKETRDESFGKGLYDYEDYGGSLDFRHTTPIDEKKQNMQTFGLQYFRREYPNYTSLLALASQTAPEKREKDFDGIKLSTGFEGKNTQGLNWEIKPSLLLKYFIDKRLISDSGILDMDKKRRDYVFSVGLNGAYPLKNGRWEIAVDNSIDYTHSNLGFYDSPTSTPTLTSAVFTKHYYSYLSLLTYPYITYYYPLGKDKRLSLRAGPSFLLRAYNDRKAQNSDGTYKGDEQRDEEYAFHANSSFPVTKTISWISSFDYTWARSNQKYEQYYRYDYNVYQIQSGISINF